MEITHVYHKKMYLANEHRVAIQVEFTYVNKKKMN
jgi:hypothetical protein